MQSRISKNFHQMSDLWGVHSTTLDPELRNERFTLISFVVICKYANEHTFLRHRFDAQIQPQCPSTCEVKAEAVLVSSSRFCTI